MERRGRIGVVGGMSIGGGKLLSFVTCGGLAGGAMASTGGGSISVGAGAWVVGVVWVGWLGVVGGGVFHALGGIGRSC